jgi:hypothetical protein
MGPNGEVTNVPGYPQASAATAGTSAGAVANAQNYAKFGPLAGGGVLPAGTSGTASAGTPPITISGYPAGTPVPLSLAQTNMTARTQYPIDTGRGTTLPPLTSQALPQSAAEWEAAIPKWTDKQAEWNASIAPAQAAQQRLNSIANAFKLTQSGAFQTNKAELDSVLKSIGLPNTFTDPGQVEIALHSNYAQTLLNLKAATSRFTQSEFKVLSEKSEHPDLQPEANLEMLTQDNATLARAIPLPQDWNNAQQLGWRNPLSFETSWVQMNPLSDMVQWQRNNIGPLKGMVGGPAVTATGPGGHKIEVQNGQWVDSVTKQPLMPTPSPPLVH